MRQSMKPQPLHAVKLTLSVLLHAPLIGLGQPTASDASDLRLTDVKIQDNRLLLAWSGGRPTYQVQSRSALDQTWTNFGTPTTTNSVELRLDASHSFFRVLSDYTARYEVLFDATWSQDTHPLDWPNPGHWSGLVGAVHNERVSFYQEGETASEGIRLMAERGQQDPLLSEVAPAIQAGTAQFGLRGPGVGVSPGTARLTFPEPVRHDFPLVTLVTMVAPSPDWFAGVSGLNLLEGGTWANQIKVNLYPFDAGTDSGPTFRSPDQVTNPRGVVTRLTVPPIAQNGSVAPFGTFTFTRLD